MEAGKVLKAEIRAVFYDELLDWRLALLDQECFIGERIFWSGMIWAHLAVYEQALEAPIFLSEQSGDRS